MEERLGLSLSLAQGYGVFEPLHELERPVFLLAETTRGAALTSAALTRRATDSPKYAELQGALRAASAELAGLAQEGTTSAAFDRVRAKRESVERDLVVLARELSGGKASGVEFDAESLAARLAKREAAVGFRRLSKWRLELGGGARLHGFGRGARRFERQSVGIRGAELEGRIEGGCAE